MCTTPPFSRPPPTQHSVTLSYPAPYTLLVTIDRAKSHNSLPLEASYELEALWQWYDAEDSLRVAIITGAGTKAFCTGMDLKGRAPGWRRFALAYSF
ncbi:uncharacterized protein PV07_08841 [Cladophialophora immunda]|uniref:3-hydroxyisobutyryl-CoA hydrolase, mitochondrial n=1 Tax=Cladophialophora immunda TaxID=569365 RepID=A0A0D2C5C7_9EURO|nr:uncharacterized protein PV07_08841 [Cladophialophora immunda]KIW25680.1 hypothetical protein PV07_08841 [Cladophialophora immunda]